VPDYLGWSLLMLLKGLDLTEAERGRLDEIVRKGRDWRERHRAQTILLLAAGLSGRAVAAQQEITAEVVYERRQRWLSRGFAALPDGPRSGAPQKLNGEHIGQVMKWADAEALTVPDLLVRLKEHFGLEVCRSTLTTALKKAGYVWKRTRHSLKKTG
jgi:transposase